MKNASHVLTIGMRIVACAVIDAQAPVVTFDRIAQADKEHHNWLTFSRTVLGHRHSPLTQITRANIQHLEPVWLWQAPSSVTRYFHPTPIVVDGALYSVQGPNDVVALDAATGHKLWTYAYAPAPVKICCKISNRGLAIVARRVGDRTS